MINNRNMLIWLQDRLKRSVADYRNLQEQTRREVKAAREFALQGFSKDLLDSVDNLDRALANVPADKLTTENQDLVNLHDGLKMVDTILMQTLKKHGLERFDPSVEGEKFDPNKHEAVFQAPMKDKADGSVFHTQQKGFIYNGRVLRVSSSILHPEILSANTLQGCQSWRCEELLDRRRFRSPLCGVLLCDFQVGRELLSSTPV